MSESKDLKPTEQSQTTAVATQAALPEGAQFGSQEDVQRSVLIVLQGSNNPIIDEGKGKEGDIYDTTLEKVVVPAGSEIEFIPLVSSRYWQVYDGQDGATMAYESNAPASKFEHSNRSTELFDGEDGRPKTRKQVYSWVVKILNDDYILPAVLKMRGASFQHGRKLSGKVYESAMFGKNIYDVVYSLSVGVSEYKMDNGKTVKAKHFVVTKKRDATQQEAGTAREWYKLLEKAEEQRRLQEPSADASSEAPF